MSEQNEAYWGFQRGLFTCHEDTVRRLLPAAEIGTLRELAADLRLGSGGRWQGMPPDLDARRQLLLDEVVKAGAEALGRPWPILSDFLPDAPADLSGIEEGNV